MVSNSIPGDILVEQVLQCMKDGIDKSDYVYPIYKPIKASVRNKDTFWTCFPDEQINRSNRLARKKQALCNGFFTESSKPYRTIGKVFLNNGEMILASLTDDFKSKLAPMPQFKRDSLEKARQSRFNADKSHVNVEQKEILVTQNHGIKTIKKHIEDVVSLKRLVQAEQSLVKYLTKKEEELNAKSVEDPFQMIPPAGRDWAMICSSFQDIASKKSESRQNGSDMAHASAVVKNLLQKSKLRNPASSTETFISHDIEEMERNEALFRQYKAKNKLICLRQKVRNINALLCAIFNTRAKYLRMKQRLTFKTALDLLRADVFMDDHGKPLPNWKHRGAANLNSRSVTVSVDASSKKEGLNSWEDFLNAGEKVVRLVAASPSVPRFSRPKRHQTIFQLAVDHPAPWQTVAQTEKAMQERKSVAFRKNCEQKYRTAVQVLSDSKYEFSKLQAKLNKELEEEFQAERLKQVKVMKCKYHCINIGPPVYEAIQQMRETAKLKLQDRTIHAIEPMQWFIDLKNEVLKATGNDDEEMNAEMKLVSRFQYEGHKSIYLGKEKICLLVMSMPAHILLATPMIDALVFVIEKIFRSSPELLDYWLTGRKLDQVGLMQKCV